MKSVFFLYNIEAENCVGLKEKECKGLGFCTSSCVFLLLTCLHTQKRPSQTIEVAFLFLRYFPDLIYSMFLSLRLIVELSSSPSTLLALSLAKMIAISCIPSAASCTQKDCLGWLRQMIMNKSELWLITTP